MQEQRAAVAMAETVNLRIPREWLADVPEEELALRQVFRLGVNQFKIEKAIRLYLDGVGSLGYIAEQLGLDKGALVHEARSRCIEPSFSDATVREEAGP